MIGLQMAQEEPLGRLPRITLLSNYHKHEAPWGDGAADRPHRGWLLGLHGAHPIPAGFGMGDRTRLYRSGFGLLASSGGWFTLTMAATDNCSLRVWDQSLAGAKRNPFFDWAPLRAFNWSKLGPPPARPAP